MKKKTKAALSIVSALAVLSGTACLAVTFAGKSYKTAPDTEFKVLQITDVHIKNDEKKDAKAFKTITESINTTSPDMIVVTGDITSEKENMTAFKTFGTFMEGFKLPWAFVFGNHEGLDVKYENGEKPDGIKTADRKQLSDYLESLEYCIYEAGDESVDGTGNYYYNVKDKNGKVLTTLIMMDSNQYNEENGGYDRFHKNQIEWYECTVKDVAKEVNGDESKPVSSLAFFHIPMQEFKTAYDSGKRISGARFEKECSPTASDEMFETMVRLGSTKACFAGHDHMNNYEAELEGIRLCYGLSCNHNIYVVPFRGARLINIKTDGSFTTQAVIRHRGQSTVTIGKEK